MSAKRGAFGLEHVSRLGMTPAPASRTGTPRKKGHTMVPGRRHVVVECVTCGWKTESSNAQGTAAQHANMHTGHEVRVQVTQHLTYIGT